MNPLIGKCLVSEGGGRDLRQEVVPPAASCRLDGHPIHFALDAADTEAVSQWRRDATARRARQSRSASFLELGPGLGAVAGILITAQKGMTHKPAAVHCNRHAAASCIGQAASHTLQSYAIAAVIGAAVGLVLAAVLLVAWRLVIGAAAAARS